MKDPNILLEHIKRSWLQGSFRAPEHRKRVKRRANGTRVAAGGGCPLAGSSEGLTQKDFGFNSALRAFFRQSRPNLEGVWEVKVYIICKKSGNTHNFHLHISMSLVLYKFVAFLHFSSSKSLSSMVKAAETLLTLHELEVERMRWKKRGRDDS